MKKMAKDDHGSLNWARVWKIFDADGDGRISFKELENTLHSLSVVKHHVKRKELKDLMRVFDDDGDGHIDLYEFCYVTKAHTTGGLPTSSG